MDLNDPRRRLQVLNNASPSIRIATQPQQKLTVSQAKPQQSISIAPPKQYNIAVPQNPNPAPAVPKYTNKFKGLTNEGTETKKLFGLDVGRFMGDYGKVTKLGANRDFESDADSFLASYDKLGDDARRIYVNDVIKKAKAGDEVAINTAKVLNDKGKLTGTFGDFLEAANNKAFGWTMNASNFNKQKDVQDRLDNFTAGQIGKEFDPITVGTDIGLTIAGGMGAAKLLSKIPAAQRIISAGGTASKVLPFLADSVGGGLTQEAISKARGRETSFAQDMATGTAIDVGANLVFKGAGKFTNLFRQGEKSSSMINDIIQEADPAKIQQVMKIDNNLANYLAQETNPDTVKEVLRQMDMDPNIQLPDEVRKRLEEEGISAVRKKDNQYGAEYDPNDSSINFRDQSFATDENTYHELGHHIFKNKLTPEEQALFKGTGEASQKAAGREGYTPADVNSEDFSDYMQKALTGRIKEVPEELRPVIAKYAKTAAAEAEDLGIAGAKAVDSPTTDFKTKVNSQVNQSLFDEGLVSGKIFESKLGDLKLGPNTDPTEAPDMAQVAKYIDDISNGKPIEPVIVERGPNGELLVDDGKHRLEALKALGIEDVPVIEKGVKSTAQTPEQAVGDVAKAQTGVSDAAPDGSVKTTSPEDAGTTFANQLDTTTENGSNALKTAPSPTLGVSPQKAEEIVPNADDETKRAVQEVLDNLNGAQKGYDDAAKIRTQQKAARISKADGAFESAGGGEAGVRAKLGALKGKYAESGFNPITASESTQNTILNDIESSSLRSFEKLNLQNAMRKIWGATEGKPTPGEINMIRKYFGEDGEQMAKSIEDAVAEDPKTWRDKIVDIAGVPRAAMASFDFSMGLRQGGQVAVRNFPDWVNANKESIKYVKNADYFKSEMKRIADDDAYETIVDKLGVRLPAVEGNSDEIMASAHILEKVPVYGRGIEASDRAYSGGLTKLRYNIAKKWIDSLGGPDEALKNLSEKELRDIGEVINTSTGSGGKKGGFTEKNMQTLATTLFAPRLWASRLNAINPAYYARLSPIARRRALENISSFMAAAGAVVGLAEASGAEVEMDPRSSDFMKIKNGNTRFDIFGGLQQNVVFFARMITGEKKNSSTGEIQTMGEGFGQPNRLDLAQDMLQNKLNPLLGYAARMLQSSDGDTGNPNDRKDRFGEDINVAQETGKLVTPLGIQGLVDTYNDTGDVGKSLAMNVPNFFGIGTQTYGETATKDQKTDSNGKIAFGGKIQDNMVLDNEGNVFMDEKNRPVKVKFDKDASETEKKAALKKAANEAYTKKAKSLLSQEDADLYATGQADPNSLDEAQKDKFDQIKKWVSDYGKSVDVPKSVKSDAAKNFYQKYNTMTKKDQENWLKESPDENAKAVTAELNKQRVAGLPEYKPSNYLAKEYAEYEKDLLEHPEYTVIDKQNKAKAFQAKAYKYNYSEDQRDIFNEGGSSDLKTLIDDGVISKADLDEAIKLDNELYASGLTGSLKFSKKFRGTYGYGTPATGKGGSGGSGGGNGGDGGSKRAYLSAYVNNSTEGSKQDVPQFSAKRRTKGISFKDVSTPKKSNAKKVTINL